MLHKHQLATYIHWDMPLSIFWTYIREVKVLVCIEDNGEDGEDNLQESKLEGAQLEQEERTPGGGTEETALR